MSSVKSSNHSRSRRSSNSSASRYKKSSIWCRRSLSMLRALDLTPALRLEHLCPMHVKAQLVRIAPSARQPPAQIGISDLLACAHLIIGRETPADHTARRPGHLYPIIHIVLLEHPRGAEAVLRNETHFIFDLRRRRLVNDSPAPDLHLVRPPRLPHANRAGKPVKREIGKNGSSRGRDLPGTHAAQTVLNFRRVFLHIFHQLNDGLGVPGTGIFRRAEPGYQNVPVATVNLAAFVPSSRLARRRIDAQLAGGAVSAGNVITIATKIFGRRFPVGGHHPTVRPAYLGAPFPAVQ